MAKKTDGSKRIAENVESIQEGFQKVLSAHGIHNLSVSHFRLTDIENEKNTSVALSANGQGCWKWVCVMTPAGPKCEKVWDPNC